MYCTKSKKSLVLYALSTVLCACVLHAGAVSMQEGRLVPKLLNYQGYLTDTLGVPINDTLDMTFKIYDAASSGNELWIESQVDVPVERGVFSVILGEGTAIPDSVFSDFTSTWLELTLEGPQTLTPRTRITSVGYAYTSTYSDTAEYAHNAAADNDWSVTDSVLFTGKYWGLARGGANNQLNGDSVMTHVNFGVACTTGSSGNNARYSTIAGGYRNIARNFAAVGGGEGNNALGEYAVIAGGANNRAIGDHAAVGGGGTNYATGDCAVVGGGANNYAMSACAAVCGGNENGADGMYSFVGGGVENTVAGSDAVIGGGLRNVVNGSHSAILGGYADTIFSTADYSYLFGINSNLTQDSTFMVDMPHIWFGTEANGYEFPRIDGVNGQVMVTDGSGQLSWNDAAASPPQVSYCASNSTDDAIGSGWNKVEFDVEDHDDGSNFSNVNDRFTSPSDGVYHFSASVMFSNCDDATQIRVALYKNGTRYVDLASGYANTAGNYQSIGGSLTIKLVTGDYVEVYAYTADATTTISGTHRYTNFSGYQIY